MASKTEQRLLERKAAKQKKLLLFLTPVFLGLLAWQGPGVVRAFTGGGAETAPAPAPATTSPPATPPATTPASPPTPPAAATPAAPPPAPAGEETGLPETDVPPEAEPGQLVGFSRFIGKDPFKQQLTGPPAGAPAGSPATSPSPGATAVPPPPASAAAPAPPPPAVSGSFPTTGPRATSARLDVNGSVETVRVRATFPASDPVFRLASISGRTVRIGLVTGAFDGGVKTVAVRVGESVVLVSKPDGLRYRIKILRLGT